MKTMKDFTIAGGYIVQTKKPYYNAIDSNFLTTNTYYLNSLMGKFDKSYVATILRYSENGKLIRFPYSLRGVDSEEARYWDDPRTLSRDNSLGCLIALSELCGEEGVDQCTKFAWDTAKRFSFFQNTHTVKMEKKFVPDFCDFGSWSIILRTTKKFNSWLCWPLFLVLDLFYLATVSIFLIKNKFFDNDYNSPLYHMISSVYYMDSVQASPVTKLNKWLLLTKCPENKKFPTSAYIGISSVGSQLMEYSRSSYDPPINEVYEKLRGSK